MMHQAGYIFHWFRIWIYEYFRYSKDSDNFGYVNQLYFWNDCVWKKNKFYLRNLNNIIIIILNKSYLYFKFWYATGS